jgi:hypothetical protein
LLLLGFIHPVAADFIESTPVGPGVVHYHEYRAAGPWQLHVLEIDYRNPWLALASAKANNTLYGYELTSSMAQRNDSEAHRVIGAINADFYESGGVPVGTQVLDGEILKLPADRTVFGSGPLRELFIENLNFQGKLWSTGGSEQVINQVNSSRSGNNLVLYNHYFGNTTQTSYNGTEVTATFISDPMINDTLQLVITAKDSIHAAGHGNNPIPTRGMVLSGTGTAAAFLNSAIFVGDTIRLLIRLIPVDFPIQTAVGGHPKIITNGLKTVPNGSFSSDRHPRTGIGFSADSTTLYFFVVDGRQTGFSVGMSLYEFADYMLEWGIDQGANLDGGGSTTMVVRGTVVNSPSDIGGERSVANALLLISSATTGPLATLQLTPQEVYLLTETQTQFTVSAFDEHYNSVSFHPDSLIWSCDFSIGSVETNGHFTAGTTLASGYVYVQHGTIRDSALVHLTEISSITLQPNPVILKVGENQVITAETRDNYGNLVALSAGEYDWSVTGDIGTISSVGTFTATQPGEGIIIAMYEAVSGSTAVTVGSAATVILDNFDNLSNWSLTGLRVNLNDCALSLSDSIKYSEPSSGRLDYSLTTGGTSVLYMDCNIPISGTPDAVGIWVYGDSSEHWLRGEFQDKDSEKFIIDFSTQSPGIDWKDSWQYLQTLLSTAVPSWSNPSATLNFPVTWTRVYLAEADDQKKDSGTIYLDDFTAHFVETDITPEKFSILPQMFRLLGNYPNPFNPSTNFEIEMNSPGRLRLLFFDINGKQVDELSQTDAPTGRYRLNWEPQNLPTGIYFYRIQVQQQTQNGKCLLMK